MSFFSLCFFSSLSGLRRRRLSLFPLLRREEVEVAAVLRVQLLRAPLVLFSVLLRFYFLHLPHIGRGLCAFSLARSRWLHESTSSENRRMERKERLSEKILYERSSRYRSLIPIKRHVHTQRERHIYIFIYIYG